MDRNDNVRKHKLYIDVFSRWKKTQSKINGNTFTDENLRKKIVNNAASLIILYARFGFDILNLEIFLQLLFSVKFYIINYS